jgi:hypothetical protein
MFLLCVVLLSVCSCTFLSEIPPSPDSSGSPATIAQHRSLAKAVEYLQAGNELEARNLLEFLVEDSAGSGVTDEALFRLSILQLRDEGTRGIVRVQQLLARLKKEFPQSVWAHQAAPLAHYLAEVKNLRDRQRELKSLRESNLSLSRDNKELRQSIEKIKNLDLELEQKIKR